MIEERSANKIVYCLTRIASILVLLILVAIPAFLVYYHRLARAAAGINEVINIQGKLVDTDGTNFSGVCGTSCDFQIKLFDASTGGSELYSETHSNVPVVDGIFNIKLGSVTSLDGDPDLTGFNRDDLYVQVALDADDNGSFEEVFNPTDRVRLSSVPYAFNAKYFGGIASSGYVKIGPSSAQADTSTNSMVFLNKTGVSGNLLQLQDGGSDAFVINHTGDIITTGNITVADIKWIGIGSGAGRIVFDDDTTDYVSIMDANVGIGTTSPGAKLEVSNSAFPVSRAIRTSSDTTTMLNAFTVEHRTSGDMANEFGSSIGFEIRDSAGVDNYIGNIGVRREGGVDNSGALVFATYVSGTAYERVRILSGGKVGIGETSPVSKLANTSTNNVDVLSNGIAADGNAITWAANAAGYVLSLNNTYASTYSNGLFIDSAYSGSTSDLLKIESAGAARFTVLGSGNVGIGTDTPAAKLSFGTYYGGAVIYLYDGGSATTRYGFGIQSSELQTYIPTAGHFSFNKGGDLQTSGSNELVRITGSGFVGIGNINPTITLDVNSGATASIAKFVSTGAIGRIDVDSTGNSGLNMNISGSNKWAASTYQAGTGNYDFVIWNTQTVNGTLVIDGSTDYVGIGTVVPAANLEVYKSGASPRIKVTTTGAGNYYANFFAASDDSDLNMGAYDDSYTGVAAYTGKSIIQGSGGNLGLAAMTAGNGIEFYAGGRTSSELRMLIDGTLGYVGIGTTAPGAKLHISDGNAVASSLLTTDYTVISVQGSSPGWSIISANNTDVTGRGVYKGVRSRGTLGSPTVPSSGDSVVSLLGAIYDGVDTEATAMVDFVVDGAVSSNIAPQRIGFFTSGTTGAARVERLTIKSNGYVGIGDSSPDYLLELYDATNTPNFALSDDDVAHGLTTLAETDVFSRLTSISPTAGGAQWTAISGNNAQALSIIGVIGSTNPTDTTPAVKIVGGKSNGTTGIADLDTGETVFQVANNDDTAALTILGGGNVGIGTISPTNILSLGNTAAQKFWIENSATDVVGRDLTMASGGTVAGTSVDDVTGGNLILQAGLGTGTGTSSILFQTGTTLTTGKTLQTMSTKMTILGNGNVGIGTTPVSNRLEIVNTDAEDDVLSVQDIDGTCIAQPEAGGFTWSCSSDARLKTNITDASSVLSYITGIPLRDYTIIKTGEQAMGPIAQEMLQLYPELVHTGADGYLQVSELSSWKLVKGIQELNAKIDSLSMSVWEMRDGKLVATTDIAVEGLSAKDATFRTVTSQYLNIGSGLLKIETNGDVSIGQNIIIGGLIQGEDGDVIIGLGEDKTGKDNQTRYSQFAIRDAAGKEVFSVNSKGDIAGAAFYESEWVEIEANSFVTVEHDFGKTPRFIDIKRAEDSEGTSPTSKGYGTDYYYEISDENSLKIVNNTSDQIFVEINILK